MQTKTVFNYLDNDYIMKGVADWLYKEDSGLLSAMPVKEVSGNGVKYNVLTTDASAAWTDTGDVIPEETALFEQRSAAIYRLIGDADVDKYHIQTNSIQNPEMVEIKNKTRGMLRQWHAAMLYGPTTTTSSSKQPKGLLRLLAELESESTTDLDGAAGQNTQVIAQEASSSVMTIAGLERMMDAIKFGCDGLIMSRVARRYLNSLSLAAGISVSMAQNEYGRNLDVFNGAKIYINDHMDNNILDGSSNVLTIASHNRAATWASTVDNTIIIGVNLGQDGVCQIQSGGFTHEPRFTVPNKDAWRHRFKWYTGFACYNKFALAALINVSTATAT